MFLITSRQRSQILLEPLKYKSSFFKRIFRVFCFTAKHFFPKFDIHFFENVQTEHNINKYFNCV